MIKILFELDKGSKVNYSFIANNNGIESSINRIVSVRGSIRDLLIYLFTLS